ncbi:MAG: SDR family NAD(P)-dependent oxidoreductase [Gammaproteobacteria bacterium]|nr:SDR family NAD(P)-dependent oxidoreductase [Gammaproteobacteria bacterium]
MSQDEEVLLNPEGRVVMISGANRGIGLAIARKLHTDGYRLSLGARRIDALSEALAAFDDERVLKCHFSATVPDSAQQWVSDTVDHFGRIDALVNNAGILRLHELDDYDEERLDEVLEVNLKAPYRLTVAALPYLRKCGTGRIININSRSGLRYVAGSADYNISKFANLALTHGARYEGWDDGVRATAICPGPTQTDMAGYIEPGRELTHPDTIAAVASLVLALPNSASVPVLPICCELEAGV